MENRRIASRAEWLEARRALLAKEKEHTRQRDALAADRRALPWVKIDKEYVFDSPNGKVTLKDLFGGKKQLVVYHFMFDPKWEAGCNSCSFITDTFQGAVLHLGARDTAFAAVSRAPLAKLEAFKK